MLRQSAAGAGLELSAARRHNRNVSSHQPELIELVPCFSTCPCDNHRAMEDRIARLTEKQRACLRLVLMHKSSKEIARELGIGVDAVDQRIKTAMKTLGVQSRVEAARLVEDTEAFARQAPVLHSEPGLLHRGRASRWVAPIRWVRRWIPQTRRSRFLFGSAVAAIVLGKAVGFLELSTGWPLDDYLIHRWEKSHPRPASGDIVLVAQDAKSMEMLGPLPWPRQVIAKLVRELDRMGAQRVAFNIFFEDRRDPAGDRALAAAFRPMDYRIILPIDWEYDPTNGKMNAYYPLPEFRRRADLVQMAITGNILSQNVDRVYYFLKLSDRSRPALALILARQLPPYWEQKLDTDFRINFSIDRRSIPTISAVDVLLGNVDPQTIRHKDILVADQDWNVTFPTPIGRVTRGDFQVLAAETLKRGPPWEIPWWMAMAPALLIIAFSWRRNSAIQSVVAIGVGISGTLLAAWRLEPYQIYLPMTAPIALLTFVGAGLSWACIRRRFAGRRAMARNPA